MYMVYLGQIVFVLHTFTAPPQVYATNGDLSNSCAISLSLFLIVQTSVVLGTGLPFALAKAGIDPANAGTSIQVRSGGALPYA